MELYREYGQFPVPDSFQSIVIKVNMGNFNIIFARIGVGDFSGTGKISPYSDLERKITSNVAE